MSEVLPVSAEERKRGLKRQQPEVLPVRRPTHAIKESSKQKPRGTHADTTPPPPPTLGFLSRAYLRVGYGSRTKHLLPDTWYGL